jgi:diguanylate cyclase (GGDEF)-like protein/PAS domain S-box-containing protein
VLHAGGDPGPQPVRRGVPDREHPAGAEVLGRSRGPDSDADLALIAPDNKILFTPKNEIIGKNVRELFPENMAELFIDAFNKARNSFDKEMVIYQSPDKTDKRWFKAEIKYIEISGRKKFAVNISNITEQKNYEKELIDKTMELDRFFSINLDLLCIADVDGSFIKVNKSWENILGYSKEYLEGKKFLDFIHPEDIKETINAMSKLEGQEQVINFVNRYRCKDGNYKYIEWRSHPYGRLIYASARDITQRKLMEDDLYIQKEKFLTTILSIGDGVISIDKKQNIVLLNSAAEKLTGWTQAEALGKPFENIFNIINEIKREKSENPVIKVLETESIVELGNHTILIRKDGTEIAVEDSAAPIKDKYGDIQGVVLVFRDVTEKKKIRKEVEYLSFHDYLTGLYNRRYFEEELLRLDTERNLPLSVLMLDVNGLKLTNDAFGHEMGDELLKKVAGIIKRNSRADDIIARTGGDEFSVILPKTDKKQAEMIKRRIMDSAAGETLDSIIISVAVGYDTKTNLNQNINEILNNSENQMYKDKIKTSRVMRNQTLQLIIGTLNNKYEMEQVHTERVSKFCYHIGLALKMAKDEIKVLETIGYLHDIGKIMVPFEILNKPGRLTEEEYELIKRHSEAGYQILKSVEEYSSLAEYVLCHHERWDGTGYPRNLKGEKIPLISRIIAVADAFESITAGRPYKRAMDKNEAVLELRRNAGTQFDPEIVEVFIEKVLNCHDYNLIG